MSASGRTMFLLWLVAGAARAAPSTDAAQVHFDRGARYAELFDYDRAIEEFEAAWALSRREVALLNIAQLYRERAESPDEPTWRIADDKRRAVEYFERFLAARPNDPERRDIEREIALLRRGMDKQRAEANALAEETARRKQAEAERDAAKQKLAASEKENKLLKEERKQEKADRADEHTRHAARVKLGLRLVVSGAILATLGTGLFFSSWVIDQSLIFFDGSTKTRFGAPHWLYVGFDAGGGALGGVGAGLVIAGVVLLALPLRQDSRVVVVPALGGLTIMGRF